MSNLNNISPLGLGLVAQKQRVINPTKKYDYLFPQAKGSYELLAKDADVPRTLELMDKIVLDTLWQTKDLAKILKRSSIPETAKAIWNFCYEHINYHLDRPGVEQLRSPRRTWADRLPPKGVDCDCFSIFISSLLTNLKIDHQFRVGDYGAGWQHVYVVIPHNGRNIIIDPVVEQFDLEHGPLRGKMDYNMNGLNGIPVQFLDGIESNNTYTPNPLEESLLISSLGCTETCNCLNQLDGLGNVAAAINADELQQAFNNDVFKLLKNVRQFIYNDPDYVINAGGAKNWITMLDYAIENWNTPNRQKALDILAEQEAIWGLDYTQFGLSKKDEQGVVELKGMGNVVVNNVLLNTRITTPAFGNKTALELLKVALDTFARDYNELGRQEFIRKAETEPTTSGYSIYKLLANLNQSSPSLKGKLYTWQEFLDVVNSDNAVQLFETAIRKILINPANVTVTNNRGFFGKIADAVGGAIKNGVSSFKDFVKDPLGEIKELLNSTWEFIKKFNPVSLAARGAYLLMLNWNLFGLATFLSQGDRRDKAANKFKDFGGDKNRFYSELDKGKNKKGLLKSVLIPGAVDGLGEPATAAAATSTVAAGSTVATGTVAAATAGTAGATTFLAKLGEAIADLFRKNKDKLTEEGFKLAQKAAEDFLNPPPTPPAPAPTPTRPNTPAPQTPTNTNTNTPAAPPRQNPPAPPSNNNTNGGFLNFVKQNALWFGLGTGVLGIAGYFLLKPSKKTRSLSGIKYSKPPIKKPIKKRKKSVKVLNLK